MKRKVESGAVHLIFFCDSRFFLVLFFSLLGNGGCGDSDHQMDQNLKAQASSEYDKLPLLGVDDLPSKVDAPSTVFTEILSESDFDLALVDGEEGFGVAEITVRVSDPGPRFSGGLNDTGITKCLGSTGARINCPSSLIKGQDGDFGRDVSFPSSADGHAGFSYTKLDQNGQSLPRSATKWSCVKDNVTGLIWEIKSADGGLRDKGWTYSWYNPDNAVNAGVPGEVDSGICAGSKCDTYHYTLSVNSIELCGYKEWRMPERAELRSLVNYSRTPTINTAFFPDTVTGKPYWTGSPYAQSSGWEPGNYKWNIFFQDGEDYFSGSIYAYPVRLVYGESK